MSVLIGERRGFGEDVFCDGLGRVWLGGGGIGFGVRYWGLLEGWM